MPVVTINPCTNPCPITELENYRLCGVNTVDSEICFVPGVDPTAATVTVDINPANFRVELVCCNLIVVCGFFTKTVTFTEGTPTARKDILVQINVPVNIINTAEELPVDEWAVTGVDICSGCFIFGCPDNANPALFHKLIEKDIVAVQVDHVGEEK